MEDNTNRILSLNDTNCFLWKKGKSKEKDYDDDYVTTTTSDDLVILRDFESNNFVSDESMWIIDSGATLHVTPRKAFFISYTASDFGVLKMSNDGVTKVIGVGDVCLQTNTGIGVKYAPDVRFNLISVHMLDDGGYDNRFGHDNHFGHGKWKLTKALVAKDSVNVMDMKASLWHQRLSHINEKGLNCLAKKDMLPGLKNAKLEKCSHCIWPIEGKEALGLCFEDKSVREVQTIPGLVERQSGKMVKCIHSDNGEYHENTPPKTPQLNGLAERMNMTLTKRVGCMLSKARLLSISGLSLFQTTLFHYLYH
ncbi:hypothetical protein CR513_05757, partial [Mucuna pruriens]